MGTIKQRFLYSEDRVINPEMMQEAVATDTEPRSKILMETLKAKVSPVLGSDSCGDALRAILRAPSANLQIIQTTMYVESLWHKYWRAICVYSIVKSVLPFCLLSLFIISGPNLVAFSLLIGLVFVAKTLLEIQLIALLRLSYFNSVWNWLELLGSLSINIYSAVRVVKSDKASDSLLCRTSLWLGSLMLGLASLSSLRIAKDYRFLIQLLT